MFTKPDSKNTARNLRAATIPNVSGGLDRLDLHQVCDEIAASHALVPTRNTFDSYRVSGATVNDASVRTLEAIEPLNITPKLATAKARKNAPSTEPEIKLELQKHLTCRCEIPKQLKKLLKTLKQKRVTPMFSD